MRSGHDIEAQGGDLMDDLADRAEREESIWDSFVQAVQADVSPWAESWNQKPSLKVFLRLLLLEPGFQLAFSVRIQALVGRAPMVGKLLRRIVWYRTCVKFNCDISPDAIIGPGVKFPHPMGIVIGGHCRVGSGAFILQGVTLGRVSPHIPTAPTIGDHVRIYARATIVGSISVGDGAVVGAHSLVLKDVPAGWIATGYPAMAKPPKG